MSRTYEQLMKKLGRVVPSEYIRSKCDVIDEINTLKHEKDAAILAHNYMDALLFFSIADLSGDSLELSRKARNVKNGTLLFCGVTFMAESAKILCPEKRVLCSVPHAGCSLAESITAEDIRALKKQYPGVPVVTYINTYADVKAETDICCTSGNALKVMASLDSDKVIFLPDEFLARNVARMAGKTLIVPSKKTENGMLEVDASTADVIAWNGHCEVHERFIPKDVKDARERYPEAVLLCHPECPPAIAEAVDYCGGTVGMIRFVEQSRARQFLIFTESAMTDVMAGLFPDREFVLINRQRCPYMNMITLENTRDALKFDRYEVDVEPEIRRRALASVERMLAIG
ncbi:MAG: quinolinate synthase NadA [Spartobacteria bacterium]|nr:quinolinate synthase NadA [Spartobacteria bacterium]